MNKLDLEFINLCLTPEKTEEQKKTLKDKFEYYILNNDLIVYIKDTKSYALTPKGSNELFNKLLENNPIALSILNAINKETEKETGKETKTNPVVDSIME